MNKSKLPSALLAATAGCAVLIASCTDPVPDTRIEDLGPELGDTNEFHRPGQPCVLCHNDNGPASSSPFSLAGTVYVRRTGKLEPAVGVEILLVDSNDSSPTDSNGPVPIFTNAVGNFRIPKSLWDPAFPIRTNIYCGANPGPVQCAAPGTRRPMQSHIGREPDCAACHYDGVGANGKRDSIKALSAVGHIYLLNE
ncbi:MAG: hypothetical protein JWM74_334 [Myxococcaceae bacterium]|jgi:hypothetical protein|nr:hypothetical protein [Myxococcaceae bacterium]